MLFLEGQHQNETVDKIEYLTKEISKRFCKDLKDLLPVVSVRFDKLDSKMELLQFRMDQEKKADNKAKEKNNKDDLPFQVNMVKNEIKMMQKVFNTKRLQQIDELDSKSKNQAQEIKAIKNKL